MRRELSDTARPAGAGSVAWHGRTFWVGPPVNDSLSFSHDRVWRWAHGEVAPPRSFAQIPQMIADLTNPPGFAQLGLCLFDEAGTAVCALGRHPRLRLRSGREAAWTQQAVLVPRDGAWSIAAVSEERLNTTVLRSPGGGELGRLDTPCWTRGPAIGKRDTLTIGTRTWRLLGRKAKSGFFGPAELLGVALVDAATDVTDADMAAEGPGRLAGDITVPFAFRWARRPDATELWTALLLTSIVIDAGHPGHVNS